MSDENKADDPSFAYRMYKKVGPDGKMYADIDGAPSDFGAYLLLATSATQLLYSQTSGAYVHLRTVTACATGVSLANVLLTNGSSASALTNKLSVIIASGATGIRTYHLADLRGPVFSKSVYVSGTKGTRVTVTGIVDPNLPSV